MNRSCLGRARSAAPLAVAFVALAAVAGAQQPAAPPSAPPPPPPPAPAFLINGFASVAYVHNFNDPPSDTNQFRIFDFKADTFKVDVVELVLQRTTPVKNSVGFRIDAEAGGSVPKISAASGLFRNSRTGEAEDFDLQQAYVTWVTGLGRGLRLDAGKFITIAGLEVIEGYDGWNDEYSRAWIFGYAMPGTHTGLKVSYPFSDKVTLTALAVQGWDNFKDNNDGKTFGAQLAVVPSAKVTLYLNTLVGPERTDSHDKRTLFDVVLILKPSPRVTLGFNGDLASDKNGAGPGRDGEWKGFAGYLRLGLSSRAALNLRGEVFDDTDGLRTGVAQRLSGGTATLEYKIGHGFLVRGEVRRDHSDQLVFETQDGASKNQTTLAGNVIYSF
jgi:hypothetical protein